MSRLLEEAGAEVGRKKTKKMMATLAVERATRDLNEKSHALAVQRLGLKKKDRMQRQILHDQVLQANSHLDACSALKQIARIELDIEKKNFAKIEYRYTTTVVYETDDEGACESEAKEKKDGTNVTSST